MLIPDFIYIVDDNYTRSEFFIKAIEIFNEKESRQKTLYELSNGDLNGISDNQKEYLINIDKLPEPCIPIKKPITTLEEVTSLHDSYDNNFSAILFLDFALLDPKFTEYSNNELCLQILDKFICHSSRIVYYYSSYQVPLSRCISSFHLRTNDKYLNNFCGIGNVASIDDAFVSICLAVIVWEKRNKNNIFNLYQSCWDNDWDNWQASSLNKPFQHDFFNNAEYTHAKRTLSWLGLDPRNDFDDNAIKGLFMAFYDNTVQDSTPARGLGYKPICPKYLKEAMLKLGISAELQPNVDAWYLPFHPGIAFLLSLKDFLEALTLDAGPRKKRDPPKRMEFRQCFDTTCTKIGLVHAIHIELNNTEKRNDGYELMKSLLIDGKKDGATGALCNLLWGNSNPPSSSTYSDLFHVNTRSTHTVVAPRFGNNTVDLFW